MKGLSYATVRSYLAGVSYYTKLQGHQDPTNQFLVCKLLQGLKRMKHTKDTRLPITKQLLQDIISILPRVCFNNYETMLYSAAFSIAFYGLLRVSEVVVTGKTSDRVLMIENLYIDHNDLSLYIGVIFSKTDQIGRGTTLHIKSTGDITCAYLSINKFLALRPHSKGPLFCYFGGSPMTRYQFTSVLYLPSIRIQRHTNHTHLELGQAQKWQ